MIYDLSWTLLVALHVLVARHVFLQVYVSSAIGAGGLFHYFIYWVQKEALETFVVAKLI